MKHFWVSPATTLPLTRLETPRIDALQSQKGLTNSAVTKSSYSSAMSSPSAESRPTQLEDNGLVFSILIDDKPVEVYKAETNGNKVTCWIESSEGKEFKVYGQSLQSFRPYMMAAHVSVDGTLMGAFTLGDMKSDVFTGPSASPTSIQPMQFSKIRLTDDSQVASHDKQFMENLGTISATCRRIMVTGEDTAPRSPSFYKQTQTRLVDEKSKKARVSHQVGLGQAMPVQARTYINGRYIDESQNPYALFEFKYRSRDLLELDDIVKPRIDIEDTSPLPNADTSASTSSCAESSTHGNKKRKASSSSKRIITKDRTIVISDDSDNEDSHDESVGRKVKVEKRIKRENGVKKEKNEVIILD